MTIEKYKYLPYCARRYKVSPNGKIVDSKGGYYYTRLVSDNGKSKVVMMHRALCYVFKHYDGTIDSLVVNHLDGDPTNNDLPNLEWCTYYKNAEHALNTGLRVKVKPVLMKELRSGKVNVFRSASDCGKYIGFESGDPITGAILKRRVLKEHYVFKYDNGKPWLKDIAYREYTPGSDMAALNVLTGELTVFAGIYQGNTLTGVPNATILRHCKNKVDYPIHGFNFRYYDDVNTFPKHSEDSLRLFKLKSENGWGSGGGVVVTNSVNRSSVMYSSVAAAAETYGVNSTTIRNYMKNRLPMSLSHLTFESFEVS